jgi:hypothetical protein
MTSSNELPVEWDGIVSGYHGGQKLTDAQRLALFAQFISSQPLCTLVPLLPMLLNLEGTPYSLIDHFPFEALFQTHMPRNIVMKTGRQVSKSTSIAAHGVILAAAIPRFTTLYVTPLYEQIRRFSSNYVRPFIEESPIKSMLVGTKTEHSVLQRSFKNRSIMHFSYAGLTADRTRGIKSDRCAFDEIQDMDPEHIDIIKESMSHSGYGISQFTGTPKTMDNTLQKLWENSSQAEWVTRCPRCNFDNVPALDWHLDKMIGKWHPDISENRPGVLCYRCGRPMSPRLGRWRHRYPDRKMVFAGFHVPQIIMPIHYANPEKWSVMISKRETLAPATFYNEVLGESCDISTKLVTQTELQIAGCLHENDESIAITKIGQYVQRVLAVDWGGGGKDGVSYTVMVVLGFTMDGKIDVIFAKKSLVPHNHVAEARECLRLFQKFHCAVLAHDYTGAGTLRETMLVQTGMTIERLMPIQYVRAAAHNILTFIPATDQHPRAHFRVDKARSLQLTCYSIKLGILKFFKYDYISPENPGLLHDFLALIEDKVPTAHGSDVYTIQRNPLLSDDFAQAVNIGCCALWHMYGAWPNFSELQDQWRADQQAMDSIGPIDSSPWDRVEETSAHAFFDPF